MPGCGGIVDEGVSRIEGSRVSPGFPGFHYPGFNTGEQGSNPRRGGVTSTMPSVLALDCALIVAVSLLGGMFPLATVLNHTRLQVYLSFSAGSMLGAVFFHMLPEAVRMGSAGTVRWAAPGLLALF